MQKTFIFPFLLALLVSACSTTAPTPISLEQQVVTLTPSQTSAPISALAPALPTETPDFIARIIPSGAPESEWNGIPIMPAAIDGEAGEQGYAFTVRSSTEEVQKYYESELAKIGIGLFSAEPGSTQDSILMIFLKGQEIITISIFPHDDLMIVLIVK